MAWFTLTWECADRIVSAAKTNKVAVIFGREDRGLTNEEISRCGYLATIPAHTDHPSLNLAQSVLIMAYELSRLEPYSHKERFVTQSELTPLLERINNILRSLDYISRGDRDLETKIMRNVTHLIGRSGLTDWEMNMFYGICTQIEEAIGKGEERSSEEIKL